MAERSNIAWTRSTFNPWIGCTKVSPGCDHCYAEALDKRHRWGGATHWGDDKPRHRTAASNWRAPLTWDRYAASERVYGELYKASCTWHKPGFWPVFCASLADVFDNQVPEAWRTDLWTLIDNTPSLSWLLVTKRIGNVRNMVPLRWAHNFFPSNVRILITVVNQDEADRDIPKLLALNCQNGISYEPALGPVNFGPYLSRTNMPGLRLMPGFRDPLPGIEWIIVGGESTQGAPARDFRVEWARRTVQQCKIAGVPVFMKQMGSRVVDRNDAGFDGCDPASWPIRPDGCDPEVEHDIHGYQENYQGADCRIRLIDRAGADPAEWPEDLRVQEFPA